MPAQYQTFESIPTEAELNRVTALAHAAKEKLYDGEQPDAEEWAALTIIAPDDATRAHRELRRKANHEQQQKAAPQARPTEPAPTLQLAWMKDGEDLASFYKRCATLATPLVVVEQVWKFAQNMNAKNIERNEKIAALEARVAQLESRPISKWCGTWAPKGYSEGNLVTRSGGLWLAMRDTSDTPGSAPDSWRLIVKKGSYDE